MTAILVNAPLGTRRLALPIRQHAGKYLVVSRRFAGKSYADRYRHDLTIDPYADRRERRYYVYEGSDEYTPPPTGAE